MRTRLTSIAVAGMLLAVLPTAAALAAVPDNDAFATATPVTGIPFADSLDVAEATVEDGEELYTCAPFANTVWYAMNLGNRSAITVDSAGSDYDTAIAVWTGSSLLDLSMVACVDDTMTLQSAVTFTAEAGVDYYIQVGAYGEIWDGSTLNLTIEKARKTQIFKGDVRGGSAGAYMDDYDEATNTWSYADLTVGEARDKQFQQRPYRSTYIYFYASEYSYDEATGASTYTDVYGYSEQGPDVLQLRNTRSAAVMTELTVAGVTCTETPSEPDGDGYWYETHCVEIGPETAVVDVTWVGSGPVFKSRFTERSSSEGWRSSYRGTYSSRDASVAGIVESDTISVSFDDAYGWLSRDSYASMSVTRIVF